MEEDEVVEIARVEPILLNLGTEIMETPDWDTVEKVVTERYDVDVDKFDVSELKPIGKRVRRKSDGKMVMLAAQKETGGTVHLSEYSLE